jgi:hypothetical protein
MGLRERVASRYLAETLPERVAERFAAKPSKRSPIPFQPRVKVRDWADITEPDGLGDFSDVTEPGQGNNYLDLTEVTKEAATKFEPGDKVQVKSTHGSPHFRGDIGVVDHYVPFGKYYVELKKNGRSLVSESDLEPAVKARQAWTGLPGDIGAIAAETEEEEKSDYGHMVDYLDQNAKKFKKGHAWWVPPHNLAINAALMEMNFWYFTVRPRFSKVYRPASDRFPEGLIIDPDWNSFKDPGWTHTKNAAEKAVELAKRMRTVPEAVKQDLKEMEAAAGVNFPDSIVSRIVNDSLKVAERRWGTDRLRRRKILVPFDGSKPMELGSWD